MVSTSEDNIIKAAQALRDEGWTLDKITNAVIREKLNGGSFATIAPVLRSWKNSQIVASSAAPEKVPEQVRPAIESAVVGFGNLFVTGWRLPLEPKWRRG